MNLKLFYESPNLLIIFFPQVEVIKKIWAKIEIEKLIGTDGMVSCNEEMKILFKVEKMDPFHLANYVDKLFKKV